MTFDFFHDESITPDQIWEELQRQNELASGVRGLFPRTARHPVVAILACMDARLDTSELVGDTRRYYYVVRTAGSVMSPAEEEMLELAVHNGVKLIVLTTHTDCAAEAAADDPEMRKKFPHLISLVDEREASIGQAGSFSTASDSPVSTASAPANWPPPTPGISRHAISCFQLDNVAGDQRKCSDFL